MAETDYLTVARIKLFIWLSAGAAGVSMIMCIAVLAATYWIRRVRQARHIIDRVSFRLFLWSMAFEIIYDISYIAVEIESGIPKTVPNSVCATGVYWMMASLGVVNYLNTCIAINLMLTICFEVNPIKKRMERWYVGISAFAGFVVPIAPAALDHFGSDPILSVCWIQASNDKTRLRNFILDLYLWQILSCVVASVTVLMTLVTLFRQRQATSQAYSGKSEGEFTLDLTNDFGPNADRRKSSRATLGHLKGRFFVIALRISMYPIALIVVNGIITAGDLYFSVQGGVKSRAAYALYALYYFLYGGRGIVFAALGMFVDPCLPKGIKEVWRIKHGKTVQEVPQRSMYNGKTSFAKQSFMEVLGGPAPILQYSGEDIEDSEEKLDVSISRPRLDSKVSVDIGNALSQLPLESSLSIKVTPHRPSMPGISPRTAHFTRSFSGVPADALPREMTDQVDVDLRKHSKSVVDSGSSYNSSALDLEAGELEALDPDLPDADEERRRRKRADQVEKEEAMRMFEETQAQL